MNQYFKSPTTKSCRRWFSSSSNNPGLSTIIFGANTDVGKTLVGAGLVRAALLQRYRTHYIKPLQCGGSDQGSIERYCQPYASDLTATTLKCWETPTSPHLAARLEGAPLDDEALLKSLATSLQQPHDVNIVETAGGCLSPSASSPMNTSYQGANCWPWQTQADLYQSWFGNVVLVGDGRLGGISATLSALEALLMRGYGVSQILTIDQPDYDASSALQEYLDMNTIRLYDGDRLGPEAVVRLPAIPSDLSIPLHDWYTETEPIFASSLNYLYQSWHGYMDDLKHDIQYASERDQDYVWTAVPNQPWQLLKNDNGMIRLQSVETNHSNTAAELTSKSRYRDLPPKLNFTYAARVALEQLVHREDMYVSYGKTLPQVVQSAIELYRSRVKEGDDETIEWIVVGVSSDAITIEDDAGILPTHYSERYESRGLFMEAPTINSDGEISFPEGWDPQDGTPTNASDDLPTRLVSQRSLHSQYREWIEVQWLAYEHCKINHKLSAVIVDSDTADPLWVHALQKVAESLNMPIIHVDSFHKDADFLWCNRFHMTFSTVELGSSSAPTPAECVAAMAYWENSS